MLTYERVSFAQADATTGLDYGWNLVLQDGRRVPWRGFYTGPLTLESQRITEICGDLLGLEVGQLQAEVERALVPAVGEKAEQPAFFLHSTTPELKTFDADLSAVLRGKTPGDFTTYKETRSVYLARPGDIVIGRTRTWKAAVEAIGADAIELPDVDHYYLSHALLSLAAAHQLKPLAAIDRLVAELRRGPRVIRLYAFEREMQIFLLWLARQAGLDTLAVEANQPAIASTWNRKSVLHPTVNQALAAEHQLAAAAPLAASELLRIESRLCHLASELGSDIPALPGYTLERAGHSAAGFTSQLVAAAELLRSRYGLEQGCLKASESGDGARITPGIKLADLAILETLGREASSHGDDYVLEAHVHYRRPTLAGQELITAVSAHIRGGRLAAGATIQFVEGTSWKGNVYLDENTHELFQVSRSQYREIRTFMADFARHFERRGGGLVLGGIDFAIGTVGGNFGDTPLLGVQDLNISFTGAECLRAFLAKARGSERLAGSHRYGVIRIFKPRLDGGDHGAFLQQTKALAESGVFADTIASIPGRWAMVGVAGADLQVALATLSELQQTLEKEGLIET